MEEKEERQGVADTAQEWGSAEQDSISQATDVREDFPEGEQGGEPRQSAPKKFRLPPLGWHAVRIAIGVFVCLIIFEFLPTMNAFYAAIATIICLKPDLRSSHRMGVRRIIGTVIGGGVGLGAMYLFESIGAKFEPYLIPFFVLMIIYLCKVIRLDESASIGCIVLLSVLIMHKPEGMLAYNYVLSRIFETVVGVLTAILINFIFEQIVKLRARRRRRE